MTKPQKKAKPQPKQRDKVTVEIAMRIAINVDAPVGVEAGDIEAALHTICDGKDLTEAQQRAWDGLNSSIQASDEYNNASSVLAFAALEHRNDYPEAEIAYAPILGMGEISFEDVEEAVKKHG